MLDLGRYELRREDRSVRLEKQPMELLILLVENQGQLVTRDQIVVRLWAAPAALDTERSINTAIRKIRLALRTTRTSRVLFRRWLARGTGLSLQCV